MKIDGCWTSTKDKTLHLLGELQDETLLAAAIGSREDLSCYSLDIELLKPNHSTHRIWGEDGSTLFSYLGTNKVAVRYDDEADDPIIFKRFDLPKETVINLYSCDKFIIDTIKK